jgi:hypothetical protein
MLGARGALAAQFNRKILDGFVEIRVGVAARKKIDHVLAQRCIVRHGSDSPCLRWCGLNRAAQSCSCAGFGHTHELIRQLRERMPLSLGVSANGERTTVESRFFFRAWRVTLDISPITLP